MNCELQLAIPESMREELLEAFHDDVFAGHLGNARTYEKLRQKYYWPGMYSDVAEWCRQCFNCTSRNNPHRKTRYPLQPLPVDGPFDRIAVDFLGPLPLTQQVNKYLIVISDYLTKWP